MVSTEYIYTTTDIDNEADVTLAATVDVYVDVCDWDASENVVTGVRLQDALLVHADGTETEVLGDELKWLEEVVYQDMDFWMPDFKASSVY